MFVRQERGQDCVEASFRNRIKLCIDVRLSGCVTSFIMFLSSYHHEIVMNYYHWQKWCSCIRSKPEVNGQGSRVQNKICHNWFPICNLRLNSHVAIWCTRLKVVCKRCPIVFQTIHLISTSYGPKKRRFWTKWSISELWLQFEFTDGYKMIHEAWSV